MERESRHSKEEEEELDRKIAQIREKNQKIVERRKPSPTPSATTKTAKGEWDREWDKGKTPADTWHENVPSMEVRRRPGRGSHQSGAQRGQRGRQKSRTTSRSTSENTVTPQKPSKDRATQSMHQKNTRKGARTSTNKSDSTRKSTPNQKQSRYTTDKYEIKKLLRKLVIKVEQLERKERQQKRKESKETKTALTEVDRPVEQSTNSKEDKAAPDTADIKENVVAKTIKSSDSPKGADANQNIIKLVEEKVLHIQMS
ncbi:hypothetical protein KIN20_028689 [Parelaphostrongylus tenuis]|uniref:Uncharacterized protein n=1 Tax=Parelaphostrongylus tenuis TaxID=148309 RepID=A0AAD5WF02_PARTN|nr:hypothetical protein KIN20_028689 [Parelaphostrongylus tenuis]